MKQLLFISAFIVANFGQSQETKRVLFIGNSYTGVNNLTQLTKDLSLSAGDTLIIDSHTPGGQTFQGHFGDATVNSKIAQGNWDFVVLQEQSQRPSFPDSQVEVEVFPFARKLDSLINIHNSCAETIFYMTWGRKNGDAGNCAFWPPVCTYSGMDSLLYLRYMQMAEDNQAIVSPVGKLWNYLRTNHPEIELYSSDESHPSLAGSYAAACSFYTTIFRKNPNLIINDYGLNSNDAQNIRNAAKLIIFDSLINWNVGKYDVISNFSFALYENNLVEFQNLSTNAVNFHWIIDDTIHYYVENPTHEFGIFDSGNHTTELFSWNDCGDTSYQIQTYNLTIVHKIEKDLNSLQIFPNPFQNKLKIKAENEIMIKLNQINGHTVFQSNFSKEHTFELDFISKGIYFLVLEDLNGKIYQKKIIKD